MPHDAQPEYRQQPLAWRTARNVVWNYAGFVYQIAINIALTWYIVRHVTVVEYGLFLFVMSLSSTLYLLDLGISSVLVQVFVEAAAAAGKDRVNELLSTAFLALTFLGAAGAFIFCVLAAFLPGPFKIPHAYLREASLIFVAAALIILVGFPSIAIEQLYQASHRFDRTNQVQLAAGTLLAVLSVVVLATGHGIVALTFVQLIVTAARLLFLILVLPASVPGVGLRLNRFKSGLLRSLIHLSGWAFLNNASSSLFDMCTWILLASLGSMEQAAVFGLAYKLPRQLWNLIDKGGTVAFPQLSECSARDDRAALRRVYLKTQQMLFGAMLPFVVLGCVAAGPIVQVWAGPRYLAAAPVLQILLLGVATHVTGYCSNQLLYACREVKRASTIAIWEYLISLVLALVLIPRYGAVGLAVAMAIGQILINCGWLTRAACRLAHTSAQMLFRAIVSGLLIPAAILGAAVAVLWFASRFLATQWQLTFGIIAGGIYLAIWGSRTLLPAFRAESESAA
ncbi:MAG TPA: oligosaccharide flippase family protein [Terracidiphilus sp.]